MKQLIKAPGLPVILGVALSVILSLILLLATSTSAIDSFIVGLIGTAIAVQIEVLVRLEQVAGDVIIRRGLGKYSRHIESISRFSGKTLENYRGKRPAISLGECLDSTLEAVRELSEGKIRSKGGDYRLLIEAMSGVHSRLEATTNMVGWGAGDVGWWHSDVGRHYWNANIEARKRGVGISRIFIVDSMKSPDPSLLQILDEQKKAGVEVRWVERSTVEPALHINIAVWDGTIAWEARTNAQGFQYENVLMYADHDLARTRRAYELLYTASRAY